MDRRTFLVRSAATVVAAAEPAVAHARAGTPLALATADDDASVVVLDLATGTLRARIPTIAGPSSIETVGRGRFALVGHAAAGAISLIDVATLRVRHELGGFGEPRYAAASPDGRHAYVTDAGRGELIVVDLERGRAIGRFDAGALARHVTITPDGKLLVAAQGPRAETVSVLDASDPRRPRLVRTFRPVDRAHDVVVSADGRALWVSSGETAQVAIHDLRTLEPVARLAADAPPQHFAIGAGRVFHASGASGRMRVHRPDGRLILTTRIPLDSYNVTFGAGHVVTPSLMLGTVSTLSDGGRFIRRVRVTRASHDACIVIGQV